MAARPVWTGIVDLDEMRRKLASGELAHGAKDIREPPPSASRRDNDWRSRWHREWPPHVAIGIDMARGRDATAMVIAFKDESGKVVQYVSGDFETCPSSPPCGGCEGCIVAQAEAAGYKPIMMTEEAAEAAHRWRGRRHGPPDLPEGGPWPPPSEAVSSGDDE